MIQDIKCGLNPSFSVQEIMCRNTIWCHNPPSPEASAAWYSNVMALLLLFHCLLLFLFGGFVLFGLYSVMQHLVSFLVLQSFCRGRESWLFYLVFSL